MLNTLACIHDRAEFPTVYTEPILSFRAFKLKQRGGRAIYFIGFSLHLRPSQSQRL